MHRRGSRKRLLLWAREQQPARLCDASQASDWPLGGNCLLHFWALVRRLPLCQLRLQLCPKLLMGNVSYEFFPFHLWVSWNRSKHGQLQGSWRRLLPCKCIGTGLSKATCYLQDSKSRRLFWSSVLVLLDFSTAFDLAPPPLFLHI